MQEKEPWDSSDKAAERLRVSDFGSVYQVSDMSRMNRFPKTYNEARKAMATFANYPLMSKSGLSATLSKKSIEKILSTKAVDGSHEFKAHLIAAGNLDKLFSTAIEPWPFEHNPNKNNDGIVAIHRLYAPMEYDRKIAIVKITVKEMKNPKDGNRIYTIKTLDADLDKKTGDAVS